MIVFSKHSSLLYLGCLQVVIDFVVVICNLMNTDIIMRLLVNLVCFTAMHGHVLDCYEIIVYTLYPIL